MAFTRAVGDTSIPSEKAVGSIGASRPITPLTSETSVISRQSLGRSNLIFGSTNVPQPARTARDPEIAPARNPRISGRQGGTGSGIGDAIGNAAKKLSPLIANAFQPDTLGGRGGMTSEQHAAFSDMGNVTAIPAAAPAPVAPVFTPATSFPASLNEGGFIRKRT